MAQQEMGCPQRPGVASLSGQLSRSQGTITPPPMDSTMVKQPPNVAPQSTMVIAPPGTPGGNPHIVPK